MYNLLCEAFHGWFAVEVSKEEERKMLELKQITKDYTVGEETVKALKGIDLQFRNN